MVLQYGDLTLKFIIGFLFMVLQINLFGRGNIAPTSAIDQLQNYVLGGIVGGMIYNSSITILQFTLVLLIWTLVVFVAKFLTNHNNLFRKVIQGDPKVIVKNGKIDVNLALKNGLSANDLSFKLRQAGIMDIRNVKRAVFERNGQLTIIMKNEDNLKYPVILDGQIDHDELEAIGKDNEWIEKELEKRDLEPSDIYMANYIDGQLVVYKY
ncbi:DUF421 domain-containing protein [Companilactobacillus pabuli]|jgi:uncharacterized membrane protein YcaP (DUF421 family)|uniref:DUF421 domain-containing protein n=1 Tax=Companilactobacillus pabuli TaxID=2714036 RepID=A0A7L7KUD3_9LACO|nr:DUF421 domain-containing protein [Companilactobacillus pabuli]AKP03340.1 membrane protein [Companilactobacillus farciminis]AKS51639.1 membrane protein [Companilactobacillus farciminis]MDG5112445.1 DUF421 domain-containing protein [Companilactobacillus pabuli]QMT83420.1 DUF421 domain-containing protein [Companilactobacillus pabuli]GAQ01274.1 membrane protein [Companilactobacillus farciminis]